MLKLLRHTNRYVLFTNEHFLPYCTCLCICIYRLKLRKIGYLDFVKQQALKRNLGWEGYTDGYFIIIDSKIEMCKCEELFLFTF